MIYLLELIKGILLAIGVIIGFIIFFALIVKKVSDSEAWDEELLLSAFQKYRNRMMDEQSYEQIDEVDAIIERLKVGYVPDAVDDYDIKTESHVVLVDGEGGTKIRVVKEYIVKSKTAI